MPHGAVGDNYLESLWTRQASLILPSERSIGKVAQPRPDALQSEALRIAPEQAGVLSCPEPQQLVEVEVLHIAELQRDGYWAVVGHPCLEISKAALIVAGSQTQDRSRAIIEFENEVDGIT